MPVFVSERQAVTRYIPACTSSAGESYSVHVVARSSLLTCAETTDNKALVFPPLICLMYYFTHGSRLSGRVQQEWTPFRASG